MGCTPQDAEDVAQQALIRLVQQDPRPPNPDAWITMTTQWLVLDLRKANRRRARPAAAGDVAEIDVGGREALERFVADGVPASFPADADAAERIWQQLEQQLKPKELEILALVVDGVLYDEIARRLGYKNADTVKVTVSRIRRKLRGKFQGFLDEAGHPQPYF